MITKYVFKKSDFYTNKGGVEHHWARYKVFFNEQRYSVQVRTNLETRRSSYKVQDACGYTLPSRGQLEKKIMCFWLEHLEGNLYDSI
jgi:hypothetical protein